MPFASARIRRVLPGTAMIAVSAALLAGCGTAKQADPLAPEATPGAVNPFAAYRDCLQRNGVLLPSGGPAGAPGGDLPPSGAAPSDGASPSAGVAPSDGAAPPDGPGASGAPDGLGGPGGPGAPGGMMSPPPGVDERTWQTGLANCASLRPSGLPQ